MVVVSGPLFSLDARGTLGDSITYQKSLNTMIAKACKFKPYSRSELQARDRNWLIWSVAQWHSIPLITRALWYVSKDYKLLTGYHSFISYFLLRTHSVLYQYEAPPYYGFCIVGNHYVGRFTVGGKYLVPLT